MCLLQFLKGKTDVEAHMINEWILAAILSVLAVIDLKYKKLPLPLLAAGIGTGAVLAGVLEIMTPAQAAVGLIPGGVMVLISRFTGEKIGYGDGMTYLMCGMFAGWYRTLWLIALSLLMASAAAGICVLRGQKNAKIPLVPFVAAAQLLFACGILFSG